MPIRTILLPLGEQGTDRALLDKALAVARRFGAHLDVLHVVPDPETILPYETLGMTPHMKQSVLEAARARADEETAALRRLFEGACKRDGTTIAACREAPERASAAWIVEHGREDAIVAQRGRLADLILVPRPAQVSPPPSTVEAALRDTGRPVLVLPPPPLASLAENAVIGWNGSKEAAQAVAAARPCLREARSVTVLTTEKRAKRAPSADDLVVYLACHGVQASVRIMDTSSRSVPEALLGDARELGADLMVVGGYSRHRMREIVMGGVTQHLLGHADLPVLMVH